MKKEDVLKTIAGIGSAVIISGSVILGVLTLDQPLKEAQDKIDKATASVLNNNSQFVNEVGGEVEDFSFTCAETEHANENYKVDIYGVAKIEGSEQIFLTTIKFDNIDEKYFKSTKDASNTKLIEALIKIMKNEKCNSIIVNRVNSFKDLDESVRRTTESPVEKYDVKNDVLVGIEGLEFSKTGNQATFVVKEAVTFSKTNMEQVYTVVGYDDKGMPNYGYKLLPKTHKETYFINQRVCVGLSDDEFAKAVKDESIVFDKFAEFVLTGQTDRYKVETEKIVKEQDASAIMGSEQGLE